MQVGSGGAEVHEKAAIGLIYMIHDSINRISLGFAQARVNKTGEG